MAPSRNDLSKALSRKDAIFRDLFWIEYGVDGELMFEFPDAKAVEVARRAKEYLEQQKTSGVLTGYDLAWVDEGLVISFQVDGGEESSFTVTYSSLS